MEIVCFSLVFILGVLMGNFTTSILHRLPRGVVLYGFDKQNTRPPFCSGCKHPLKFYEYLPILSWISTLGKCNYCNMQIPPSYFYIEILGGIFAVICMVLYGNNLDNSILMFAFFLMSSLAFFLSRENSGASGVLTVALIIVGMLYRTLNDQSIMPWLGSFSLFSIVSLLILKQKMKSVWRQELVHLILPASIWLNSYWFFIFAISIFLLWSIRLNVYRKNISILVLIVMAQSLL